MENNNQANEYVVIKALDNGVCVMGVAKSGNARYNHTEKLAKGEVYIFQFCENTSAFKVTGNAEILTKYGTIKSENSEN